MHRAGVFCLALGVLAFGASAVASTDSRLDANEPGIPDDLDLRAVSHSDSSTQIVYSARTEAGSPYTPGPPSPEFLAWFLDFDGDSTDDACVAGFLADGRNITGGFFIADANGACRGGFLGSVTVERDGNNFTITWDRSLLANVPEAAGRTSYSYRAASRQRDPNRRRYDDFVPDTERITHSLDTPIPGTPVPTPTPTPAPTPTPTPTPTTTSGLPTIVLLDSDGNSTTRFLPGDEGEVAGTGLAPSTDHQVLFGQSPDVVIAAGRSGAGGALRIAFEIPTTATPGAARVTVRPLFGTDRVIPITIVAAAAGEGAEVRPISTSTVSLPNTGYDIGELVTFAMFTAVTGSLLLAYRRVLRPRPRPSHERQGR